VHHAAQVIDVGPLATQDAVTLLHATAGEHIAVQPGGAELLASRCGGLPLALRIAAEMVTAHPAQDLPALDRESDDGDATLTMLDTGDDQHSAVRTVFFWSYRALPGPVATAFRLLALHPGNSFALPAVAALLGVPPLDAAPVLRALVNAHLVIQPAGDRYEMHDLLRRYARELSAQDDIETTRLGATRRMFDHYLHAADRADRMVMPHRYRIVLDGTARTEPEFPERSSAVRWFAQERRNLVDLCRLEAAEFDARRWQLAYVLRDYFYLNKHLDGWLETHRLAVTGCMRLGDRRAEGMTRNNLGRALLEAGQPEAAAAQYRRAHSLLSAADDQHGVIDSLVNLASVLRRQGACTQALRNQATALAFYRQAGLARKIGITLRGIARTELALGRLAEAVGHAEEALARFLELQLDLDAAQSLNTLAQIHYERGDTESAEATGHRAIEYSHRAGSGYEKARALHQLGRAAALAGRTHLARQRLTGALAILDQLGSAEAAEVVRSELGSLAQDPNR
jgi:tetratricopeptide (TPR) repeat protein